MFLQMANGKPVALKTLALKHLGKVIQTDVHDSVEDAKACMELYNKFSFNWENNY